jgi:putative acetyltransferase
MSLIIRPETINDQQAVRRVHMAAFNRPGEADLVDLLRQNGKAVISLVAELDEQVVGHLMFSPVQIVGASLNLRGLGLAPVGVLPPFQRQGAGTGMIQLGLKMAHLRGHDYAVVLGDPDYYHRFRFRTASEFGLGNEYGVDEEFMALEFRRGCLAGNSGVVKYAKEFMLVD